MTTNTYEVETDKLLAKRNPDYYNGLKKILSEFEEHLISNKVISEATYQNYMGLLEQIIADDKISFKIKYNLQEAFNQLNSGQQEIKFSTEKSILAGKFLNNEHSKIFLFQQRANEVFFNSKKINRSEIAQLMLETFNEEDFQLPQIKLIILRFLDVKSKGVMYFFAGRPNPE